MRGGVIPSVAEQWSLKYARPRNNGKVDADQEQKSFSLRNKLNNHKLVKMADVEMEDPDPIKASYEVFIKPHMSGTQQVFILQFPNRDSRQHYSAKHQSQPLKMRVKPTAGMVELDVPMDVWRNYDKEKGVRWGGAMKKSKANHGLPGGFGIGGSVTAGRGRARNVPEEYAAQQASIENFDNAVRDEQVLLKQTLGGQTIPSEENTPQYMIGTFEKGNVSRISAYHLD